MRKQVLAEATDQNVNFIQMPEPFLRNDIRRHGCAFLPVNHFASSQPVYENKVV